MRSPRSAATGSRAKRNDHLVVDNILATLSLERRRAAHSVAHVEAETLIFITLVVIAVAVMQMLLA